MTGAQNVSPDSPGRPRDPTGAEAATSSDEIAVLRSIVEGTVRGTGEEFFQSLVRHLAKALDVHYAFVAEFARVNTRVRTLAYWTPAGIADNIEFDLEGTPCEDVVRGNLCHYPSGVQRLFPRDRGLVDLGIESYLGVPLRDDGGNVLGHLAVCDSHPMSAEPRRLYIFRIFAARAAAELERLRAEQKLQESEQRYRELYDDAPIAYVSTDNDGRLTSVNRAAARLLGRPVDGLNGRLLLDMFAETVSGRVRARELFANVSGSGLVSGTALEMRAAAGDSRWIDLWVRQVLSPAGAPAGCRSLWIDVTEQVLAQCERLRLEQQNLYLQEEIKAAHNFDEIVGRSAQIAAVLENVERVAPTDTTVLITGETGTGKELIARALHSHSRRKDRPLIKVNCAALPASLVESELFGHEKGAFTGAIARRVGRFELAHGGTIFLDEIGEVPPEVQVKLLRVLQEREFERVGGTAPINIDVRVIAATNRDLLSAVRAGKFREDLFYRLNVFPVDLPALRDRPDDIPLLVQFLIGKFAARVGKKIDGVSRATMERLWAYPWPGNVRELENVLERAVILSKGPTLEIDSDVLAISPAATDGSGAPPDPSLESVERVHIVAVLDRANWVIEGARGAAKILGLHPNTLRSRMKKLGISRVSHDMS
jgi:PAS domain S-box-containing protein